MPPDASSKRLWPEGKVADFIDHLSAGSDDYRRLVERLPAIIYAAELGEQGRWLYVSPQLEKILGYTPEEWMEDPELWARLPAPRGPRAGTGAGEPPHPRRAQPAAGRLQDGHTRR